MEEPTFLLAVDRVVGGVEVEHDLLRRSLVAIEEDVHEQCFQARRIVIDLVILPGLAPRPVLQPVERALAGHRRTVRTLGLELAGQHMEQRVVTKLIVVVQVFIAEREGEHALADQGLDRVLEQSWVAPVGETAGHPTDQPEAAIQPPQQQPSGIRCDDSAIEPGHNLVPFNRFKFEQCWATLCLHRGLSGIAVSDWRIAIFRDSPPRCIKGFEKSGLGIPSPGLFGEHRGAARAVGQHYSNRYGGFDEIADSLRTDPVGTALDVGGVLAGGAAAGARLPGTAGRLAAAITKADPIAAGGRAVSRAVQARRGKSTKAFIEGAPTPGQLQTQGASLFEKAEKSGVRFKPEATSVRLKIE